MFCVQFNEELVGACDLNTATVPIIFSNIIIRLHQEYNGLATFAEYSRLYSNLAYQLFTKMEFGRLFKKFRKRFGSVADIFDEEWVVKCSIPNVVDIANMCKLLAQALQPCGQGASNGQHRVCSQIMILGSFSKTENTDGVGGMGIDRKQLFSDGRDATEPVMLDFDTYKNVLGPSLEFPNARFGNPTFNLLFCPLEFDFQDGIKSALQLSRNIEHAETQKQITNMRDIFNVMLSSYIDASSVKDSLEFVCNNGFKYLEKASIVVKPHHLPMNTVIDYPDITLPPLGKVLMNFYSGAEHQKKLDFWSQGGSTICKMALRATKRNVLVSPVKGKPSIPDKPKTVGDLCILVNSLMSEMTEGYKTEVPKMQGQCFGDYVYGEHRGYFTDNFDLLYRISFLFQKKKGYCVEADFLKTIFEKKLSEIVIKPTKILYTVSTMQAIICQNIWIFWNSILSQNWDQLETIMKSNEKNRVVKHASTHFTKFEPWMFTTFTYCAHNHSNFMVKGDVPISPAERNTVPMMPKGLVPLLQFISYLALDTITLQHFGETVSNVPNEVPGILFDELHLYEFARRLIGGEPAKTPDALAVLDHDSASSKQVSDYCSFCCCACCQETDSFTHNLLFSGTVEYT